MLFRSRKAKRAAFGGGEEGGSTSDGRRGVGVERRRRRSSVEHLRRKGRGRRANGELKEERVLGTLLVGGHEHRTRQKRSKKGSSPDTSSVVEGAEEKEARRSIDKATQTSTHVSETQERGRGKAASNESKTAGGITTEHGDETQDATA